ncbi:collagen, type I, alpha 1a [Pongo abelii]|uniref:collagen, type I, alpha 1a n=1 Tax=Pongo abelii TaxID=9601 RepID=UPI003003EE0B
MYKSIHLSNSVSLDFRIFASLIALLSFHLDLAACLRLEDSDPKPSIPFTIPFTILDRVDSGGEGARGGCPREKAPRGLGCPRPGTPKHTKEEPEWSPERIPQPAPAAHLPARPLLGLRQPRPLRWRTRRSLRWAGGGRALGEGGERARPPGPLLGPGAPEPRDWPPEAAGGARGGGCSGGGPGADLPEAPERAAAPPSCDSLGAWLLTAQGSAGVPAHFSGLTREMSGPLGKSGLRLPSAAASPPRCAGPWGLRAAPPRGAGPATHIGVWTDTAASRFNQESPRPVQPVGAPNARAWSSIWVCGAAVLTLRPAAHQRFIHVNSTLSSLRAKPGALTHWVLKEY